MKGHIADLERGIVILSSHIKLKAINSRLCKPHRWGSTNGEMG